MKYLILAALLLFINKAKAIEIEALAGYAHHYNKMATYNDKTFNNNQTSDVLLARISHNNISLNALSDSQGNLSIAPTYSIILDQEPTFKLSAILGLYIMRDDNRQYTSQFELPQISVGERDFSIMPLVGIELDIHITQNLDFTTVISPTFTLIGIKVSLWLTYILLI